MLKRIELAGFKSFAKKTTLDFGVPITAIVGPNGSGKSNIVESIRFVLGEQSMKSLRGKGGVDLIFKGSKNLSALSRASVAVVFDNSTRIFQVPRTGEETLKIDFDEITISREVYSDGKNIYRLNGSEVRLKDLVELLASVNIGSSGHHIISQGEADRLLSANPKDRRAMVEDALGLRVYQFRLREAERKLERTEENIREVNAQRREVAPHLTFLKKQVEKVEKTAELRSDLAAIYKEYFALESVYVANEGTRLAQIAKELDGQLAEIDQKLSGARVLSEVDVESPLKQEREEAQAKLSEANATRDELTRKLGRIEGTISALEARLSQPAPKSPTGALSVPRDLVSALVSEVRSLQESLSSPEKLSTIISSLLSRAEALEKIATGAGPQVVEVDKEAILAEIESFRASYRAIEEEVNEVEKIAHTFREKLGDIAAKEQEMQRAARDRDRAYYEAKSEKTELESRRRMVALEEESLALARERFDVDLREAGALVGLDAIRFEKSDAPYDKTAQDARRYKIERAKIKLEEAGAVSGAEVLKEYESTKERDEFLARELVDLEQSVSDLRALIRELRETIDTKFKEGVELINKEFTKFFSLMFGGGSAFLSIVVEHKRASKSEDDEDIEEAEEEGELTFERGIEINVSMPHKKVKDLHMLSGGERSLTSIALLFAMSQVNPPPFLVLDETDAALDEANSRRYGDMLENLSDRSKLIVVTHNRETMSRAGVLYGITIGADGGSKLLSIKFDEAVKIAK
jgi:chromosome segregation protein